MLEAILLRDPSHPGHHDFKLNSGTRTVTPPSRSILSRLQVDLFKFALRAELGCHCGSHAGARNTGAWATATASHSGSDNLTGTS